jgi:acyl-CoA thioesterase FadM
MFRLLFLLLILRIKPNRGFLQSIHSRYWVRPWDCDINIHLNNAQYLRYLEWARVDHMIHTDYFQKLTSVGARTLVANAEISYVRSLLPFQRFESLARVSGWDDRYVYYEQRLLRHGQVYASAIFRMALIQGGQTVSPVTLLAQLYPNITPPSLPQSALHLKQLIQAQRHETTVPLPQSAPSEPCATGIES